MNFLKNCIASGVKAIIGIFVIFVALAVASAFIGYDKHKDNYYKGYLKVGAEYFDSDENYFKNQKRVKVEVSKDKIAMPTGKGVVQVYFLEGRRSGQYGYTYEENIEK